MTLLVMDDPARGRSQSIALAGQQKPARSPSSSARAVGWLKFASTSAWQSATDVQRTAAIATGMQIPG